mgnify:CR=1 FL=1
MSGELLGKLDRVGQGPGEYVRLRDFEVKDDEIIATCAVNTLGKTGVEMEAITGVSVALLTVWDMVKAVEKDEDGQYPDTRISDIKVIKV